MKPTTILIPLLTSWALAGPVKRAVVTVWETEIFTVWVKAAAATPHPHWGQPAALHSLSSHLPIEQQPSTTTTAPAIVPQTSQPAQQVNYQGDSDGFAAYAASALEHHNLHRANHSVSALVWDEDLVSIAKEHAFSCIYAHSRSYGDGNYGQNIGAGYRADEITNMLTNGMYNGEITKYPGYGHEPDMTLFEEWGHFSQIVWKDTQRVGCYTHKCDVLGKTSGNVPPFFTVCNYRPMGNNPNAYARNVLAPLNEPSVIV